MSKNRTIQKALHKSGLYFKKYSPVALSCVASVGVVITAIIAIRATPKAIELIKADSRRNHGGDPNAHTKSEAVLSAWKCYIPSVITGVATIACILGANALNRRQQAALASAYALLNQSYQEYKTKLKELYGEDAHNAIVDSFVKEKCEDRYIYCPGLCCSYTLDFDEGIEPEIVRTFYDSFSERYFESTISKVLQAEYHLNRNFVLGDDVNLNTFYDFLGLEPTEFGRTVGWPGCTSDFYWIDFNHHKIVLDDGMEIFVIEMAEPTPDYLDEF